MKQYNNIETIIDNIELEDFITNLEKRLAIERLLEIIGEASNHISDEILYHPKISAPWRKIIANRNLIAHEYFTIDYKIIYQIAKEEIVPLKKDIQTILKDLDQYLK